MEARAIKSAECAAPANYDAGLLCLDPYMWPSRIFSYPGTDEDEPSASQKAVTELLVKGVPYNQLIVNATEAQIIEAVVSALNDYLIRANVYALNITERDGFKISVVTNDILERLYKEYGQERAGRNFFVAPYHICVVRSSDQEPESRKKQRRGYDRRVLADFIWDLAYALAYNAGGLHVSMPDEASLPNIAAEYGFEMQDQKNGFSGVPKAYAVWNQGVARFIAGQSLRRLAGADTSNRQEIIDLGSDPLVHFIDYLLLRKAKSASQRQELEVALLRDYAAGRRTQAAFALLGLTATEIAMITALDYATGEEMYNTILECFPDFRSFHERWEDSMVCVPVHQ